MKETIDHITIGGHEASPSDVPPPRDPEATNGIDWDTDGLRQDCVVKWGAPPFLGAGQQVFVEGDTFFRSRFPRSTHWSVAWSDLMMTMFILFAVMYVYQAAQREFLAGDDLGHEMSAAAGRNIAGERGGGFFGPSSQEGPDILFDLGKEAVEKELADTMVTVDLAPDKSVRIIITGDLLFDTGKAELKDRAVATLEKVGEVLRRTPHIVNVVGHTDNIPMHSEQFPTNWELSAARATVVARYLMERLGLPANRFYVTGHAYLRPIRPNDNAENRAANRRVEIIVTREMPGGIPGTVQSEGL